MEQNWCEQLVSVGLSTFSEDHRNAMASLVSNGMPVQCALFTETAAEAIIRAVAAMLVENNKALRTD